MQCIIASKQPNQLTNCDAGIALFNWSQLDISDLPFVQNKEYQYSVSQLDILK